MANESEQVKYEVQVPAEGAEYRLSTYVNAEYDRGMVHLDFLQPDPNAEGRAFCVGRIALHPDAATALADVLSHVRPSED
jgi:hypothetical protein